MSNHFALGEHGCLLSLREDGLYDVTLDKSDGSRFIAQFTVGEWDDWEQKYLLSWDDEDDAPVIAEIERRAKGLTA